MVRPANRQPAAVGRSLPFALALALLGAAVPAQTDRIVPSGDQEGRARMATFVERHGIRWQFDRAYPVGSFANGDPWVLGPVRIVAISPRCVERDGRVLHGSMVDPDPSRMLQGYDSALFGDKERERYRDELNVAFGLDADHPLELGAGHSLVSVRSRPQVDVVPQLKSAAVLTCLATRPAPDAFRPPYVAGDKTMPYRAAHLDFSQLRRVKPTLDAPPIDVVASRFERLWLDHFPEWPVRYSHPLDDMPDYGRDIAAQVGNGALALMFDLDAGKKRTLLIRMTQIGIDLHAALRGGCRWMGIGGHGHGRKFPILLAGLVLHDERMLSVGEEFVSRIESPEKGTHYFAEDGQTFYVEQTSEGVWNWGFGGYGKEHEGLPEWGFNHTQHVQTDNAIWDADPYRRCCSANGWVGECLAARMLGLQGYWNHSAWFDYMDRYMQVKHEEGWHRAWVGWQASMWDAYRANY